MAKYSLFNLDFLCTVYTLLLHVCFCVPVFYLFFAALARHSSACCFSRKNVVVFGRYVFLWINVLCRPRNSDRKWTSHSAWRSNICNNTLSWCYECGNKNACVRMGIVHNTVDFVLRNSSAVAPFYLFCLILSQPQYPSHVSDCTEFKMNKQGIVIFHNSERFFSYWLMVSTETWNGFCLLIGLNEYGTNCNERRSSILVAAAITAKNSVWKLWNIRTENFYSWAGDANIIYTDLIVTLRANFIFIKYRSNWCHHVNWVKTCANNVRVWSAGCAWYCFNALIVLRKYDFSDKIGWD